MSKYVISRQCLNKLRSLASTLGVLDISEVVLNDDRFVVWSGSSKPFQHHYGDGGLCTHTYEVANLCLENAKIMNLDDLSVELFLSALFHDCGKMWDYQKINGEWTSTPHKRLIHHISRSSIIWNESVIKFPDYEYLKDSVTHNILSHHGLREFGSPVMPKTRTAWLLHFCDGISARMNDSEKWDMVLNDSQNLNKI